MFAQVSSTAIYARSEVETQDPACSVKPAPTGERTAVSNAGVAESGKPAPSGGAQKHANTVATSSSTAIAVRSNTGKQSLGSAAMGTNLVVHEENETDSDDDVVFEEGNRDTALLPERTTDGPEGRKATSILDMLSVQPSTLRKRGRAAEQWGATRTRQHGRRSTGEVLQRAVHKRNAADTRRTTISQLSCACVPRSVWQSTVGRSEPCADGANCARLARKSRGPCPSRMLLLLTLSSDWKCFWVWPEVRMRSR